MDYSFTNFNKVSNINLEHHINMVKDIINTYDVALEAINNNVDIHDIRDHMIYRRITLGLCDTIRRQYNHLYHDLNYSIIEDLKRINEKLKRSSSNFIDNANSTRNHFFCDPPKRYLEYKSIHPRGVIRDRLRKTIVYRKEVLELWLKLNDKDYDRKSN